MAVPLGFCQFNWKAHFDLTGRLKGEKMFKSIARVVFVVLISLGVIAASSPNVQARLGSILQKADANSASALISADAKSSANGRARYFQQDSFSQDFSHDCDSKDPISDY